MIRQLVRGLTRRAGLELSRYPQSDPLWRVARLLGAHGVDRLLDVGANNGGYAAAVRGFGYSGQISSFEPVQEPFQKLAFVSAADPAWRVHKCAIGATKGDIIINVAGNAAASSSVLPMLDRHLREAPSSAYVGQEQVPQQRLDDVLAQGDGNRLFLKIDVQGYERFVLDGAQQLLASGRIVGLQMELSFVPLYDGGMSWREGFDRAEALGMILMSLDQGFTADSGQMLQADGVFFIPHATES